VEPSSEDDVDVSLIRWMLALTPEERLDVLQGFVDSVDELRVDSEPLPISARAIPEEREK
jgi:hypothetical protein